jgi:hypothetical protein
VPQVAWVPWWAPLRFCGPVRRRQTALQN